MDTGQRKYGPTELIISTVYVYICGERIHKNKKDMRIQVQLYMYSFIIGALSESDVGDNHMLTTFNALPDDIQRRSVRHT